VTLPQELRRAYDAAGAAWADGPSRVYAALAHPLLAALGDVRDRVALDVGTGSGVVASALRARGARVVATDASWGMLRHDAAHRCPAVVGDVTALPFRDGACDVAAAGFVLNHLRDPGAGLRELGRVVGPRGTLAATCFDGDPVHDAKGVVDEVAAGYGFEPPEWYSTVKREVHPLLGSAAAMRSTALAAGLAQVRVAASVVRESFPAQELVAWRLGMAHLAGFVQSLSGDRRTALTDEAVRRLPSPPPLELSVVVLTASGR
jgi:ubiquinone/menaquinone biosynthesis C-methylase UbiE